MLWALQRALDPKLWQIMGEFGAWLRELPYLSTAGSARACGVGVCPCIVRTLGALGETSGPRIDRIPPTRPPWRRRLYRELKKLIFSAPSTCPIDLFGPLANGTVLKRLHARSEFALLVSLQAASCRGCWPSFPVWAGIGSNWRSYTGGKHRS